MGNFFWKHLLLILTVGSVVLGIVAGFLARNLNLDAQDKMVVGFPGEVLMRMLKMMILPLIMSSLISGLSQLDARQSSKMGSLAVTYYIATTVLAVITGIILVLTIHPGDPSIKQEIGTGRAGKNVSTLDTMLDLVRNTFPENIVQATFEQAQTKYVAKKVDLVRTNDTRSIEEINKASNMVATIEYIPGMNVLGVIVFCIAVGIVLSQMGEEANVMIQFFVILDKVIMKLVMAVMWYSPIGIFCLIVNRILEIPNIGDAARMLAMYMITVISGLAIHSLITLPIVFFVFTRKNPYTFMKGLAQAWVTALGTASSSATLPITYKCLEENLGVDRRVTRFVLPVGATINMDGTALYEAVAAIFIAQVNGVNLSFVQVVTVSLTATLASIGAASVPSAGLVTMLLVLTAVGLPVSDVMLIVAVDWMLDRIRTSINVLGDAFGAGIVYHYVEKDLKEHDAERRLSLRHPFVDEDKLLASVHVDGDGYHRVSTTAH
ncbi:unnamed protein product, partial [Mesorhabditis spiculigera]